MNILKWFSKSVGINFKSIKKIRIKPNQFDVLKNKKIDFMLAHENNEPLALMKSGVATNFISLSTKAGLKFGIVFFCKRSFLEKNKMALRKFLEVTLKGWEYALNNPKKTAKIIASSNYSNSDDLQTIFKSIVRKYYMTFGVGTECIGCMTKHIGILH